MINREVVTLVPTLPVGYATGVLTSDNSNPAQGDTVSINSHVYTFATGVAGIAATGVLTSTNVNASNNDTVVIGTTTYTFKTSLTEVKATATVTDGNTTNISDNDTITVNGRVYRFKGTIAQIDDIHIVASVAATGLITSNNTNVSDADTITINDQTYRFKTIPAQANDIQISVIDANGTLANLRAAINQSGTPGVEYFAGTVAPTDVTAGAVNTGAHTLTVTAGTLGITGNSYTLTKSAATLSLSGSGTMTGGVDNADASLLNLARAINHSGTEGTDYYTGTVINANVSSSTSVTSHAITLTAKTVGTGGNAITLVKSAASLTLGNATGGHLNGGVASVANEIKIAGNADATLTNLASAINGAGTPGTDYSTATVTNTDVSSSSVSSHALTLTELAVGTAGNAIATTTTAVTLSWGAVTLTGGIDAVNSVLIGASADATLTNLASAINGTAGAGSTYGTGTPVNTDVSAGAVSSHTITVTAFTGGVGGNAITTTKSSSHLTWGDTTLIGGEGGAITGQTLDGAQAYTTNSIDVSSYAELIGFINMITHSGSNPTLDCKMQLSPDNKNWVDSADAFTQLTTGNALAFKRFTANFGKYVRFVLTLGGTDPHYNLDMKVLGKL